MTNQNRSIDNCDQFNDALAALLERELPEHERAAMEAHALACGDCGPLLADLRKLRLDAANLPELAPSRDLWAGIAARIETPVVEIGAGHSAPARRHRSALWTGLAAAALVGVTATTTYLLTARSAASPVSPATNVAVTPAKSEPVAVLGTQPVDSIAAPAKAAPSVAQQAPRGAAVTLASNKPSADVTYSSEITRLRKIVDRRRGELDSSTVAVLEKNLKIIDDAIVQCRQALRQDPASAYLNESLNDALDNKVRLLRTAAGLPTKM